MNRIHTDKAPEAIGPYSQAVVANGLVWTSGQIALVPSLGQLAEGGIVEQTTQVMENLKAVLDAACSSLDLVIKTTCFLADMKDFAVFNEIYARYITGKPGRSCVAVKELPKGALVEVEVIAELKQQ